MKTLKLLLCIVVFGHSVLAFTTNNSIYPIAAKPLRYLVEESQYIVVGHVVKVYDVPHVANSYKNRIAKIAVLENLQGQVGLDTIEIAFDQYASCPKGDAYFENTHVISFFDQKDGKLETHALSYGSKTLSLSDIEVYKKRIFEMQRILKIEDKEKQFAEIVEWSVKCAEHKATRWEGLADLAFQISRFMYVASDKAKFLNEDQKERLTKVLLKKVPTTGIENRDYTLELIPFVYNGKNDQQLYAFIIAELKLIKKDNNWFAIDLMQGLKRKMDTDQIKDLLLRFRSIKFDDGKKNERQQIINEFILLLSR